ncbi:MAG: histidinol-phosphatase [Hyphomicrobiales bacterium]|nr:histidinol-phosphatase [Hyphomicrobiales bacterium]
MADLPVSADLVAFLDRLADAASAAIRPHFRSRLAVENKLAGLAFDPVTVADRAAEAAMRELIGAHHPDHGILGEEYGSERLDAEHVWVLDPIDGTRSFITGLPVWGTLIGLKRGGRPALGMMAQPFTGERYAGDGSRAWYRGPEGDRPLTARACARIEDAVLFTTTPALFDAEERPAYDRVESRVRLARYGVDCYAYCMVAAGFADVVIEAGLQPYDIVALIPVIEGAGGVVTSWTGGAAADGGRVVASGDPCLHDEVLRLLAVA